MFCGNCGNKLAGQVNFCGNCGARVIQSAPVANQTNTGNISKSIKQEISSLPLVSLIGDTIKGASGLSDLQVQLQNDQRNPLLWLFYYEGFVTYNKMNKGASVARIIYNPVGFAVSKGIATGLNAMDDEYEKFDPSKCLSVALAFCMDKVKNKAATSIDLLIVGKTLYYMGINESNVKMKESYFLRSIKYLSLAIKTEKDRRHIAEYFFYLGQVYGLAGNKKLQFRSFNLSRKMGFIPSLEVLRKELKDRGVTEEQFNRMSLNQSPESIHQFKFTFKLDTTSRIESSLKFAFNEQSKKIKTTSSRIKNFFS
jgi:hypothetical protein